MSSKLLTSTIKAVAHIPPGSTILVGGFGLCGIPSTLIKVLAGTKEIQSLNVVSNTAGTDEHGLGLLINSGKIRKITSSYIGENKALEAQYLAGKIDLELVPQGTLAEKLRAGGAGIPAFYTATGAGT
jgi:3-oxoacid CoA-transferase subunit A